MNCDPERVGDGNLDNDAMNCDPERVVDGNAFHVLNIPKLDLCVDLVF
jgi:hypothetical protein